MPDFMQDYWSYISQYEIPRNYSFWSALGLLGAIVNRKVYFLHGDIEIHANVYVLMVGPVGNGKSTACDFARELFEKVCPDLEIGASTQSAEDIVVQMSKPEFAKCFTNELNEQIEVRPYAFFINEFKDFIAYSPTRMLNFLGDIYDRKRFKSSTIKRGTEDIINPCLNILGCENPDQLIKLMKNDVVTGGMSRRVILVYETEYADAKSFIDISDEARAAWKRVENRLIESRKIVGCFKWADSGKKFYRPWYEGNKNSLKNITNVIMQGYTSTKHVQLFKICMLLDVCSDKPMLLFTDELLELGLSFLNVIEKNMPKLSAASGRNELAGPQLKLMEILTSHGGLMTEAQLKKDIGGEMNPTEIYNVLRFLEETEQILKKQFKKEGDQIARWHIITPERYKSGQESGQFMKQPQQGK